MRPCPIDGRRPKNSYWIATLILILLVFAPACSDDKVSRTHIKLEDLPQDKKSLSSRPTQVLPPPMCPSAGLTPLQASAPHTGHHKVFLKWNASEPPKNPKAEDVRREVVGYCLYRSKKKMAAKKNPKCQDCEVINTIPIPGTACVDTLVEDGMTYYYVATAIARNSDLSISSNEIPVKIPRSEKPIGDPPPGDYPSCRAPSPEKLGLPIH